MAFSIPHNVQMTAVLISRLSSITHVNRLCSEKYSPDNVRLSLVYSGDEE